MSERSISKTIVRGTVIGLLMCGACVGSETGNGARPRERRPISVSLHLGVGAGPVALVDADGEVFTLDGARLSVTGIDLVMPSGDDCQSLPDEVVGDQVACRGDRWKIDGAWVADALGGAFTPALDGVEVLTGEFDSLDMRLSEGVAGSGAVLAGDALDGATVDLAGSVLIEGVARRFGLTLAFDKFMHFRGDDGLVIDEGDEALELSLDPSAWFESLTLAGCIADGEVPEVDGVLRLEAADRRACGDVAKAVERALTVPGAAVAKGRRDVAAGRP